MSEREPRPPLNEKVVLTSAAGTLMVIGATLMVASYSEGHQNSSLFVTGLACFAAGSVMLAYSKFS